MSDQPYVDPNQAARIAEQANQLANSLVNGAANFGDSASQFGVFGRKATEYNQENHSGWNPQNPNPSERRREERHSGNQQQNPEQTGLNGPSVKDSVSTAIKVSDGNGVRGNISDGSGMTETMTVGANGTYNRMAPVDTSNIGRVVIDTAKSPYNETDAGMGARKVRKAVALTGVTSMGSVSGKYSVENAVWGHNNARVSAILGGKYRTSESHTGNAVNDYRFNVDSVGSYLRKKGYGTDGLTLRRVNHEINTIERVEKDVTSDFLSRAGVKEVSELTDKQRQVLEKAISERLPDTVKFSSAQDRADTLAMLKEWGRLKGQENAYKAAQGKGAKSLAGQWAESLYGDTDAYRGYQSAKTVIRSAQAAKKLGLGAAGLGVNAALEAPKLVGKAVVTGQRVGVGGQKLRATITGDSKALAHWNAVDGKLKLTSANISSGSTGVWKKLTDAQSKVRYNVKTPFKTKVKDGAKKIAKATGLTDTAPFKALGQLGVKRMALLGAIGKNPLVKVMGAPVKLLKNVTGFLGAIKRAIMAILLKAAFGLIIAFVVCGVMGTFFVGFDAHASYGDKSEGDDGLKNIHTANVQKMIDHLWSYQKAYSINICKAELGSEYIEKGIPDSWHLHDEAGELEDTLDTVYIDPYVLGQHATITDEGEIKGYNLSHYWGPAILKWTAILTPVEPEEEEGEPADPEEGGEEEEEEEFRFRDMEFTLFGGIGGLEGDVGGITDDDTAYIVDGYEDLEQHIHDGTPEGEDILSEAYSQMPDKLNTNVKVTFEYHGSQYVYEYTDEKYEQYYPYGYDVKYPYDIEKLYKAFVCAALAFTDNVEDNPEFYIKYSKQIFDKVMENAEVTLATVYEEDPSQEIKWKVIDGESRQEYLCEATGYRPLVNLTVDIKDCGLPDMFHLDEVDDEWAHSNGSTGAYAPDALQPYVWPGWYLEDGSNSLPNQTAYTYFEVGDDDWDILYPNIVFPGETADLLSDEEIEYILSQIAESYSMPGGLTPEREEFIRFAISCVGKFYYEYGSGHGNIKDLDNPPAGLDCSGFVSYALFMGGVDETYKPRSCAQLLGSYPRTLFNHDFDSIAPGTLLIANNKAGTESGSSNHVVIYIGKLQFADDEEPRDYCVECTNSYSARTGDGVTGTQLSSVKRMRSIKGYRYALDPFM